MQHLSGKSLKMWPQTLAVFMLAKKCPWIHTLKFRLGKKTIDTIGIIELKKTIETIYFMAKVYLITSVEYAYMLLFLLLHSIKIKEHDLLQIQISEFHSLTAYLWSSTFFLDLDLLQHWVIWTVIILHSSDSVLFWWVTTGSQNFIFPPLNAKLSPREALQYWCFNSWFLFKEENLKTWNKHCHKTTPETGKPLHNVHLEQERCLMAKAVQMVKPLIFPGTPCSLAEIRSLQWPINLSLAKHSYSTEIHKYRTS